MPENIFKNYDQQNPYLQYIEAPVLTNTNAKISNR